MLKVVSTLSLLFISFSTLSYSQKCKCGIEGWKERVVGGRESIPYIYPWLVSIINEDRDPYCGGSLISHDYVLTAAHCVIDTENNNTPKKKSHVRIVFGAHDMFKRRKTITFRVEDWKVHPLFKSVDNYDIALIKLKIPQKLRNRLTSKFMPICLPDTEFSRSNKFRVAGWGQVKEGGFWSRKLLEAIVNGTSLQECRDKFDDQNLITDRHLCAGNSRRDSCKGDSGGPLMQKKRGKMYLHGIASYGDECAHNWKPGIYTRVYSYLRWIMDNTKDSVICQPDS